MSNYAPNTAERIARWGFICVAYRLGATQDEIARFLKISRTVVAYYLNRAKYK